MFKKKILSFVMLSGLCLSFAWALTAAPVSAAGIIDKIKGTDSTEGVNYNAIATNVYGTADQNKLSNVTIYIINAILGLLGLIFLVLIVYAGFLWMTAAGNDDQVKKAKSILTAAIIGVIIIIAAYAISNFVLDALSKVGQS